MATSLNLLITGAGSPGAPGVIKSLRLNKEIKMRLIGTDINPTSAGRALVDTFYIVPRAEDPEFLSQMLELCRKEQIDVVLPLVSSELPLFSKYHNEFKKSGTTISVSLPGPLECALNKGMVLQTLEKKGFRVPEYKIVRTSRDLKQAIYQLGYPNSVVCIKPTKGDGGRGFHILDAKKDRFQLLYNEKPSTTYISEYELFDILKGHEMIPETVVMEFLPNAEYSVDLLVDNGKVMVAVPRLRQAIVSGISVKCQIEKASDVVSYTTQIVESLGLNGNIGVQVRRDEKLEPKIIEINPRIQGTIVHCTASGVNLPFLAVKLAKGLPITNEELEIKWGTQMVRYWNEIFYDENLIMLSMKGEV